MRLSDIADMGFILLGGLVFGIGLGIGLAVMDLVVRFAR